MAYLREKGVYELFSSFFIEISGKEDISFSPAPVAALGWALPTI
jgi:hypothetical protein